MSTVIITPFKTATTTAGLHIISLSLPPETKDGLVRVMSGKKFLGNKRMTEIRATSLSNLGDINKSTLHPMYQDPARLWRSIETAYGSGLPGEFVVYLVTLTDPSVSAPALSPSQKAPKIVKSKEVEAAEQVVVDANTPPAKPEYTGVYLDHEKPTVGRPTSDPVPVDVPAAELPEQMERKFKDAEPFERFEHKKSKLSWDD